MVYVIFRPPWDAVTEVKVQARLAVRWPMTWVSASLCSRDWSMSGSMSGSTGRLTPRIYFSCECTCTLPWVLQGWSRSKHALLTSSNNDCVFGDSPVTSAGGGERHWWAYQATCMCAHVCRRFCGRKQPFKWSLGISILLFLFHTSFSRRMSGFSVDMFHPPLRLTSFVR